MGKIIGGVIVVGLLVGGLWYWNVQRKPLAVTDSLTDTTGGVQGIASSIKDAMNFGQKMQCTYAIAQGEKPVTSTVVIDGSKFKSTTALGEMTVYALFDGSDQYTWTSLAKVGSKMSKTCLEKLRERTKDVSTPTVSAPTEPQDMQSAFDVAKNVACEAAPNADFSLPKDVAFTDQCALMEQSTKALEGVQNQLPAGITIPGMPSGRE